MTATWEQLGIDRMSVAERIALAQEILDSVAADAKRREPENCSTNLSGKDLELAYRQMVQDEAREAEALD